MPSDMPGRTTPCTRSVTRPLPWLLLVLCVPGLALGASKTDKIKAEICDQLVAVAAWCQANDMHDVAAAHVTEALGLSKNHADAKALRGKLGEGSVASDEAKSKYERTIWRRAAPKLAAQYLKLFKQSHGAKQQPTWDGYLIRAYVLAPSKARSTFEKTWRAALKKAENDRVRRLLLVARNVEDGGRSSAARAAALEATAPGNVRVAKTFVELARWCQEQGLGLRAAPLLQEALYHDPTSETALALRKQIDADAEGGSVARDAYGAKWHEVRPSLAKAYLRMSKDAGKLKKDPKRHYELYLARAFALDPEGVAAPFDKAWRDAEAAKDWARVSALLVRAADVGDGRRPSSRNAAREVRDEALERAERVHAVTRPIYRKARFGPKPEQEMCYWLCLPKGWTPEKKWPVVVCCDGRLCIFKARAQSFLRHRGERPFIIVSPCTFANTNDLKTTLTGFSKEKGFSDSKPTNKYLVPSEYRTATQVVQQAVVQHYSDALIEHMNPRRLERAQFDVDGLQAVLTDVRRNYGGEKRVYITGWSGGGVLTWSMTLGYTHLVAAAAPACGNFMAGLHKAVAPSQAFSTDPSRKTLPINGFQGLKDRYLTMLEAQWASAEKTCSSLGFESLARTDLPEVAHKDCVKQVWEFFEKVWRERSGT